MTPTEVVLRFVAAINSRDIDQISALMTEDHLFIDPGGDEVRGRGAMRQAWADYFRMVPDYAIEVRQSLSDASTVVLLGTARGTYSPDGALAPENAWAAPAAWRAEVAGAKVSLWQVFADNEPIRRVMRRCGAAPE